MTVKKIKKKIYKYELIFDNNLNIIYIDFIDSKCTKDSIITYYSVHSNSFSFISKSVNPRYNNIVTCGISYESFKSNSTISVEIIKSIYENKK